MTSKPVLSGMDELLKLAEDFAEARYDEAHDHDHGNGRAESLACQREVERSRAALTNKLSEMNAAAQARVAFAEEVKRHAIAFARASSGQPLEGHTSYAHQAGTEWRQLVEAIDRLAGIQTG